MIDEKKLKISSLGWTKVYDKFYRKYHRLKFETTRVTDLGVLGVMISKQNENMVIHLYVRGYYWKYPKMSKDYKTTRKYMKHAVNTYFNRVEKKLIDHATTPLLPFEFFKAMDKALHQTKSGKRTTQRIMEMYVKHPHNDKQIVFYDVWSEIVQRRKNGDITEVNEKIITIFTKWFFEFPYDPHWYETRNLAEFTVKNTQYGYVHKLPYQDFLELIEDWSEDEVIEMIGRYRPLRLWEYNKDKRRILYTILEAKIEKY